PTIDMTDFNRQLEDSRQTSRQFLRDFGQDLTDTFMRPLAGDTFLEKLGEHVPTVTAHVHDLNDALGATDDNASKRAKQIADMLACRRREADTFGEPRAAIVA